MKSFIYSPCTNKKTVFLQLLWYAISSPWDFLTALQGQVDYNILRLRVQKTQVKQFCGFMKGVLFMFEQRLMSKQCGEIFKVECKMKTLKFEGLGSAEGIKLCLFN